MSNPLIPLPHFERNSTVSLCKESGKLAIYRILDTTPKEVCAIEIGKVNFPYSGAPVFSPNGPPRNARSWEIWAEDFYMPRFNHCLLRPTPDKFIPLHMTETSIPSGEDSELDLRRAAVQFLDRSFGMTILADQFSYRCAIKHASFRFNAAQCDVRGWYEIHLFYGRHPNALMHRHWNRGTRILKSI
ncbi:hypothetical protein [Herbaspirillum hiltneri]|uniref:hypothetical protein n=1 Tax=Herbaspirillum hiltneri TaxID=341045 RepID=UPI000A9A1EE0|nr:hypothetical protein [Herbaspirillum hiltneri]